MLLMIGMLTASAPALGQCDQLVWADEFSTPGDFAKWRVYEGDGCEVNLCGFGNAELQVYRAANATISNGTLQIQTQYQTSTQGNRVYQYTSAKLFSKMPTGALQTFRYGRIEARMKLPSAQGVWPAFWMLANPNNWPSTGEIDIMEAKHRNPRSVAGTIHYDANGWRYTGQQSPGTVDLSAGFHTYAVEWSPGEIKWFVDANNYFTATPQSTVNNVWPFDAGNFYLMLNAAVGGPNTNFTGNQNPVPGDFPTTTEIDYVRVYGGSYSYSINGPNEAAFGQLNVPFSVVPVAGATYFWTAPAGATLVAGQGTPAAQINWGTTSGPVTVTVAVAGCAAHTYSKQVQAVLPPPVGPNLALRKRVTASSVEDAGTPTARLASYAVDGDATTRWGSDFTNNEWLSVDLQAAYDLTQVVLRWEAAYATAYQIQTSLDGLTWFNRYTTTTGNGVLDNLPVGGLARYVRVSCQQRATQYGFSLYELEVYGNLPAPTALPTETAAPAVTRLFPNPATTQLSIESNRVIRSWTMTDALGRPLRHQALRPDETTAVLPLVDIPAGIYQLRIQYENGQVEVRKVVKE